MDCLIINIYIFSALPSYMFYFFNHGLLLNSFSEGLSGFLFVYIGILVASKLKEKISHHLLLIAILILVISLFQNKQNSVNALFFVIGSTWCAFSYHKKKHLLHSQNHFE